MPQSIFTTLNLSSLKNNLWPLYKLLSSFSLLFTQLQLWIWIPYIKTFFWLSLVTQLQQNTSLQIASGLQIQTVFSFLTIEFMYHLLVISIYASSSITMITSLLNIMVKIKQQNQFATNIPSPVPVLMYNNSTSPMSLVCNSSHNVTSSTDLSNNFLSLNNHGIPFLQTLLKNFCHSPDLTLSWSQLTGSLSR